MNLPGLSRPARGPGRAKWICPRRAGMASRGRTARPVAEVPPPVDGCRASPMPPSPARSPGFARLPSEDRGRKGIVPRLRNRGFCCIHVLSSPARDRRGPVRAAHSLPALGPPPIRAFSGRRRAIWPDHSQPARSRRCFWEKGFQKRPEQPIGNAVRVWDCFSGRDDPSANPPCVLCPDHYSAAKGVIGTADITRSEPFCTSKL
jgi:hypothetical protein